MCESMSMEDLAVLGTFANFGLQFPWTLQEIVRFPSVQDNTLCTITVLVDEPLVGA